MAEGVDANPWLRLGGLVVLLILLYKAEGLQIAALQLSEKEPNQLEDDDLIDVVSELTDRIEDFLAQRQLLVVAIVAAATQLVSFPWIEVPGFGRISNGTVTYLFTLFLVTFTALWFSQITSQKLANRNAVRFLAASRAVWKWCLKPLGHFGMTDPATVPTSFVARYGGYERERSLRPSRKTHYNTRAQLVGTALDRYSVTYTIKDNGRISIQQKSLALYIQGRHKKIISHIGAAAQFKTTPQLTPRAAYVAPVPEDLDEYTADLDAIFEGESPTTEARFSDNLFEYWQYHQRDPHTREVQRNNQRGWEAQLRLTSDRTLPDGFVSWLENNAPQELPEASHYSDRSLVCILYETVVETEPGASPTETDASDFWDEPFYTPSRRFDLQVKTNDDIQVTPELDHCDISHIGESRRAREEMNRVHGLDGIPGLSQVRIPYPLDGLWYRLVWRITETGNG